MSDLELLRDAPRSAMIPRWYASTCRAYLPGDRVRVLIDAYSVDAPDRSLSCRGAAGEVVRVEGLQGGPAYTVRLARGERVRVGPGALEPRGARP